MFPDYIKFSLFDELVKEINNLITPYKDNIKEAVIYSFFINPNKF